jgi:hypothetical protein
MRRALPIVLALLTGPWVAAQSLDGEPSIELILSRVAETLERYYAEAQSVICTETVTQQALNNDLSPDASFPRRLVYALRVAWDATEGGITPEPRLERNLISANGRAPRPNDKPRCTDPEREREAEDRRQLLLSGHQGDYIFSRAGSARINGRHAILIDYKPRVRGKASAEAIDTGRKDEDCYSIQMPGYDAGRVWIDVETAEVLRLDERTTGRADMRVRSPRRGQMPLDFTVERNDVSTIYRPVTFTDPDETLMMPASSETLFVVRGLGGAGRRESRRFTEYRRFRTEGRLIEDP